METRRYRGLWLGHAFIELELAQLLTAAAPTAPPRSTLHYKYMPRTGHPGQADAAYATMTPAENPTLVVEERLVGTGSVLLHRSTWEQLPTLYHIVNKLAEFPLGALLRAELTRSRGGRIGWINAF